VTYCFLMFFVHRVYHSNSTSYDPRCYIGGVTYLTTHPLMMVVDAPRCGSHCTKATKAENAYHVRVPVSEFGDCTVQHTLRSEKVSTRVSPTQTCYNR
jgi:hypothetical protein